MKSLTTIGGVDIITLVDVYINGVFFRDHSFIKNTKRLKYFREYDKISFTALVNLYPNPHTNKMDKVGFKHIRNVRRMV